MWLKFDTTAFVAELILFNLICNMTVIICGNCFVFLPFVMEQPQSPWPRV